MSIDFELAQDPSDSVVVLEDVSVTPSEASVSSETGSLGEVEEEDLGGIVGDPYMPGDGDEAIGVFDETHMISTYRLLELMVEVPASVSYGDQFQTLADGVQSICRARRHVMSNSQGG